MSWNPYADYLLTNGVCEYGAIIGKDGSLWGCSPAASFQLRNEAVNVPTEADPDKTEKINVSEAKNLIEASLNKGRVTSNNAGVRINGEKYQTVNFDTDKNLWYLKKPKGGACIAISTQTIIFGSYSSDKKMINGASQTPGECNKYVENLREMIAKLNY